MPACHDMCMEAFDKFDDQARLALVPLTMVVLFDESVGKQTGAGVRPKEPQKKPMHIMPLLLDDVPEDEEGGGGTVIVLDAVADLPPPEHVTV